MTDDLHPLTLFIGTSEHEGLGTQVLLFVLLLVAAVTDLRARKVYNSVTVPAMLLGFLLAGLRGGPPLLLEHFMWGFLPAVAIFGLVVWSRGMGGGDMKLMAAVGAIKGFPFTLEAMFWSSLIGAAMALGLLAWNGSFWRGLRRSLGAFLSMRSAAPDEPLLKTQIPYGVAISIGTLLQWFMVELSGGFPQ